MMLNTKYRICDTPHERFILLRIAWWLVAGCLLLGGAACTPEDENLTYEEGALLAFSQDTVQFDTVFTTVGSTTQWLRVYNPQRNAVNIASIALGANTEGASPYRMVVNGDPGTQFQDVRLRGGDSLLVLVEVQIDPQDANLPFIVKDSIVFRTNGSVQTVNLEAWGQDAYFLKSQVIMQDTTFLGDRPYVVCDSLWVQPSATLTLAAGTRLYFNDRASLLMDGTLRAEGTPEARVLLQHVRTEGDYENAPGQWQGLLFGPESKDNRLDFAVIRNADVGIGIRSPDNDTVPDIILANTIIENMAGYGVVALNTDVEAYNTVISNCALGLVQGLGVAYYRFRHCSLINAYNNFSRENDHPSLLFVQGFPEQNDLTQTFSLEIVNSIIWGDLDNELQIDKILPGDRFRLLSTLIKSTDTTASLANINLYNQEPQFVNPRLYNYQLDSLSPAIDAGVAVGIDQDIEGNPRDANPDVGAYEYVEQ